MDKINQAGDKGLVALSGVVRSRKQGITRKVSSKVSSNKRVAIMKSSSFKLKFKILWLFI